MDILTAWRARRSGGRITINGTDETGAHVKVPNVDTIEVRVINRGQIGQLEHHIVARDKDGEEYRLLAQAV